MCGICGIALTSRSRRRIDIAKVTSMRDALTHRGPDDAGVYVDDRIALGHRRLSIIDVAHGHQPMSNDDGRLQIVYNGEVFNHPQLSSELQARGVRYRTHCDTETVLRIYEQEGTATPRRLRGMFAFAIWDRRRGELLLARDRFGVKPLYYAQTDDGSLYFGSEIKALLATGAIPPQLNVDALPDFLANHAPSGDETLFAGVKRLPPGHTLQWRDGDIRIEPYWDLTFASDGVAPQASQADMIAEYGERLREAVRLRLMSDVPLGSFLSGGIDSAAITAIMSELAGGPVKTFSVAFAEREANELEYARLVAGRFRTEHHEVLVTPSEFFEELPALIWHEDEPLAHPSSVPLNFVSRLAARHVKVVLTGEGSDETLAGYGRYARTLQNVQFGRLWERFGGTRIRGALRRAIDRMPARGRWRDRLSRTFLYQPADVFSLYFDGFAVFSREGQRQLLSSSARERLSAIDPYAAFRHALERTDAESLLDQLLYADTKTYLHELLMKQDQMSMAASVESRVPFLDHPLVEFAARLPQSMKLRGSTTKFVLRRAMANLLPAEILRRPKMGFPVPISDWLGGPYQRIVDEYLLGERARARGLFDDTAVARLVASHRRREGNHAERLWALLNLELWQRMFLDGESVGDARLEMLNVLAEPMLLSQTRWKGSRGSKAAAVPGTGHFATDAESV